MSDLVDGLRMIAAMPNLVGPASGWCKAAADLIESLRSRISDLDAECTATMREISTLRAERDEARKALEPFAAFAEKAEGFVQARAEQGGSPNMSTKHFRLEDFRRARDAFRALSETEVKP